MSNRYLYLHVSLLHHALSFDCWLKHRCDREQTRHRRSSVTVLPLRTIPVPHYLMLVFIVIAASSTP